MSTDTNNNNTVAPVAWFEIGTDDPAAARAFYGGLFGWTFDVDGPYSMAKYAADGPPQGGIQDTSVELPDGTPRSYAVPYVLVPDVAAMCQDVEGRGGKVMVAATTVPTGLVYAHVTDPFGNHFGLYSLPG